MGINPTGLDWRRFVVIRGEDGRLLACAQIKPHRDGTRELASLAVTPACRGQGLARQLVEHLLAQNAPPLYLTCARRLQPLYERFGFRRLQPAQMPPDLGRLSRWINGPARLLRRPDPMLVMRWDGSR